MVGAGPAAMCAIAKLIGSQGVDAQKVTWIDPCFRVGAFGSSLSAGSSVPGNTDVESYLKVINGIGALLPACQVPEEAWKSFAIASVDKSDHNKTCPIKIAAEPLQYVSDRLADLVTSIRGWVTSVDVAEASTEGSFNNTSARSQGAPLKVSFRDTTKEAITNDEKNASSPSSEERYIHTKRVLLATGAEARTLSLPTDNITSIHPNSAFISSELETLIKEYNAITDPHRPMKFAVVGSSHSAALAAMNILNAGQEVMQFMNKPYKFATKKVTPEGKTYTQYDNTGLKGDVAAFTRQLLAEKETSPSEVSTSTKQKESSPAAGLWSYTIGTGEISPELIADCTHSVVCIGYRHSDTMTLMNHGLSDYVHNHHTSSLIPGVKGVFGIGIAFPKQVVSPSGEEELAVGVGKFWATIDTEMMTYWQDNPSC